jgi:hypothetical protein
MNSKEHFEILINKQESVYILSGSYGIYVPCGSQLACWFDFPRAITFTLATRGGEVLKSIEGLSSVSHDQSTIEYYAGLPCNQVVVKTFSMPLSDFFWDELPQGLRGATLAGEYLGLESNAVVI